MFEKFQETSMVKRDFKKITFWAGGRNFWLVVQSSLEKSILAKKSEKEHFQQIFGARFLECFVLCYDLRPT